MRNTIFVVFNDGVLYEFDADETSIYNILNRINDLVQSGTEKISYHTKDCECEYFSNEDMALLVDAASQFQQESRVRKIAKTNSLVRKMVEKAYPYDEDADIAYFDGFPCVLGPEVDSMQI